MPLEKAAEREYPGCFLVFIFRIYYEIIPSMKTELRIGKSYLFFQPS